jgi:hypothetical protein
MPDGHFMTDSPSTRHSRSSRSRSSSRSSSSGCVVAHPPHYPLTILYKSIAKLEQPHLPFTTGGGRRDSRARAVRGQQGEAKFRRDFEVAHGRFCHFSICAPVYFSRGSPRKQTDMNSPPVARTSETEPSWPRSWANFSLLYLYPHWNARANLYLLGQPDTFLARGCLKAHLLGQPNTFLARGCLKAHGGPGERKGGAPRWRARHPVGGRRGYRARSHCRFVPSTHSLHTRIANIFGASFF